MKEIYNSGNGLSVFEDSIDIKSLLKTKNIKISEISSVETNPLFKTISLTTKDKKKYSSKFTLKEYLESTASFLHGKIDTDEYKMRSKRLEIFEANKPMLSDPDKIYPGQKLIIPKL